MKPFQYISSNSIAETLQILSEYKEYAKILAGGTDLLIELRRNPAKYPKAILDIGFIDELNGIYTENGSVILRPLTTHTQLIKSELIIKHAFLLSEAASQIGSLQIRNRGTVGGNIMNAAACADTVPPLVVLDAEVSLQSSNGTRKFKLADFFIKPYRTKANPDEVLTEIKFQKLSEDTKSKFIKLGRRNALAISRLSVATAIKLDANGVIQEARIVPGAALPTWRRIYEAEQILIGEKPSQKLFDTAGKIVSEVMISYTGRRWSTEYKEPVIAALVRRALEECAYL